MLLHLSDLADSGSLQVLRSSWAIMNVGMCIAMVLACPSEKALALVELLKQGKGRMQRDVRSTSTEESKSSRFEETQSKQRFILLISLHVGFGPT